MVFLNFVEITATLSHGWHYLLENEMILLKLIACNYDYLIYIIQIKCQILWMNYSNNEFEWKEIVIILFLNSQIITQKFPHLEKP